MSLVYRSWKIVDVAWKRSTLMRFRLCVAIAAPLLAVLLPSCSGNSGSPTTPSQPVAPPSGSFTISPNGSALVGATVVSFAATASDPGGSALTYTWDFGDGQRGVTGQAATHVFDSAGTFTVVLTIRNAGGASATANGTVTARTLAGNWVDQDPHVRFELAQSGKTLSGRRIADPSRGFIEEGSVTGIVADPRKVSLEISFDPNPCGYEGTASADLNMIAVTRTKSGPFCGQTSYSITRQ
jgi:hypothetical protein